MTINNAFFSLGRLPTATEKQHRQTSNHPPTQKTNPTAAHFFSHLHSSSSGRGQQQISSPSSPAKPDKSLAAGTPPWSCRHLKQGRLRRKKNITDLPKTEKEREQIENKKKIKSTDLFAFFVRLQVTVGVTTGREEKRRRKQGRSARFWHR